MRATYWLVAIPSIPVVGLALNIHPTLGGAFTLTLIPCAVVVILNTVERLLCGAGPQGGS